MPEVLPTVDQPPPFMNLALLCVESKEQASVLAGLVPTHLNLRARHVLSRCAMRVVERHHDAIIEATIKGNTTSAAAMLRPLFEAGICSFWLIYAAKSDHVRQLSLKEADNRLVDVPDLKSMLPPVESALKKEMPGISRMVQAVNSPEGRWLNKWTHGGLTLLRRQGLIEPFAETEAFLNVVRADIFALVATGLASVIYPPLPELDRYIAARRKVIWDRLQMVNKSPEEFDEWIPFPAPALDDDWDEFEGS